MAESKVIGQRHPVKGKTCLILVGFRATGKSTLAKMVAESLGFRFVDADELLEKRARMPIPEIVEKEGWRGFRQRELNLWRELRGKDGLVIAAGGGAVLSPEIRNIMAEMGLVVWLRADPTTIAQRLKAHEEEGLKRPALKGQDPVKEAAEVLREREPLYEEASHAKIDTDGLTPKEAAAEILKLFEEGRER